MSVAAAEIDRANTPVCRRGRAGDQTCALEAIRRVVIAPVVISED